MTNYYYGGARATMLIENIMIRSVWEFNLKEEFEVIKSCYQLLGFRWASFDTEFPGTIYGQYSTSSIHAAAAATTPLDSYNHLKANVDATNIIQLGLTLSNGTDFIVWEFNFNDFNLERGDLHNSVSVQLLKDHGLDFDKTAKDGIKSKDFAELLKSSGLLFGKNNLTWVGFHCAIDFGYLIKILTQKPLPTQLNEFINLVWYYFGTNIYDLKYMKQYCNGLSGGLNRVANVLQVERCVGTSHQAGSDSLLTMMTYMKMVTLFFSHLHSEDFYLMFGGVLFGFEVHLIQTQTTKVVMNQPGDYPQVEVQVAASESADSCYNVQPAY